MMIYKLTITASKICVTRYPYWTNIRFFSTFPLFEIAKKNAKNAKKNGFYTLKFDFY